jgi:hypothetical protein
MRDIDIRIKVKETYLKKYYLDNDSKVVDEFAVSLGEARMDITVINGSLHGYEIKSDSDTLNRLPNQIEIYSRTFDYLTIIAGKKHLTNVLERVPDNWGIIVASHYKNKDGIKLSVIRKPKKNLNVDKLSLAQLLWKDEIIDILHNKGIKKGLSKPKPFLWNKLIENFSTRELSKIVRNKLKIRKAWRSDETLSQSDDYCQLVSKL